MGNYDQFTDVAVFPDLCMDTMLPPGMLRNKTLGLDKSLMGLEMRGGGGSHTTTNVENKYDDQWIKNWQRDAEGREAGYLGRIGTLEGQARDAIAARLGLQSDISGIRGRLGGIDENLANQLTRLGDLESREFQVGDVSGLQDRLTEMTGGFTTSISDLADITSTNLSTLRNRFEDEQRLGARNRNEIRSDIAGVKGDLSTYQQTMLGNLENLESTLRSEYTGELAELGDYFTNLHTTDLASLEDTLRGDYSSKLSDLDTTFQDKYAGLSSDLSAGLSALTGQQVLMGSEAEAERTRIENELATSTTLSESERAALEARLSGDISGVESALADYRTDVASQFQDVDTTFQAYRDDLQSEQQNRQAAITDLASQLTSGLQAESSARAGAISGIRDDLSTGLQTEASTRAGQISGVRGELQSGLQSEASTRAGQISGVRGELQSGLQQQEQALTGRIEDTREALNKRLTDLSRSMNYRMLGDSALGIRSRRSKNYRSGRTSKGTKQLGRSMKISTLNI